MSKPDIEEGFDSSSNMAPPIALADDCPKVRKPIDAESWSLGMKIYHTAIPCFLAFLMYV